MTIIGLLLAVVVLPYRVAKMKIFLINLKKDTERLKHFFDNLPGCWNKEDITVIEAVDGNITPIPDWFAINSNSKGTYGCYKSHLNIIESIKNISLILEDDVIFHKDFSTIYPNLINKISNLDYDIFYLGGKHLSRPTSISYGDTSIKKCRQTIFTHAYMIKDGYKAKKISNLLKNKYTWEHYLPLKNYEIDLLYGKLQKDLLNCYTADPFLAFQNRQFKSNIKNK